MFRGRQVYLDINTVSEIHRQSTQLLICRGKEWLRKYPVSWSQSGRQNSKQSNKPSPDGYGVEISSALVQSLLQLRQLLQGEEKRQLLLSFFLSSPDPILRIVAP